MIEGIYQSKNNLTVSVLRFYTDMSVYSVSIPKSDSQSIEDLSWFKRENYEEIWGEGIYKIEEDEIFFVSKSKFGSIFYRGKILDGFEISFTVENLVNSHSSLINYRKVTLKESSPLAKDSTNNLKSRYYPVVLIPEKILNIIQDGVSKNEILDHLGLDLPVLKKTNKPNYPNKYRYIEVEKSEFRGDGCITILQIPMGVFFIIIFFYSLRDPGLLSIIFLVGSIVMLSNLFQWKQYTENKKIELTNTEFEILTEKYNSEIKEIDIQNKKCKELYNKELSKLEREIRSKRNKIEGDLFYTFLKPVTGIYDKKENIKRGKTELLFLSHLFKNFKDQIKVDCKLGNENGYQPDFVLICNKTGVHIDIEIDEPYSLKEKEPIHYIGCQDDIRNDLFLDNNWIIIRFSEKQILNEVSECIALIKNILHAILTKSLKYDIPLKKDKRWTYEESLVMSFNDVRENYN